MKTLTPAFERKLLLVLAKHDATNNYGVTRWDKQGKPTPEFLVRARTCSKELTQLLEPYSVQALGDWYVSKVGTDMTDLELELHMFVMDCRMVHAVSETMTVAPESEDSVEYSEEYDKLSSWWNSYTPQEKLALWKSKNVTPPQEFSEQTRQHFKQTLAKYVETQTEELSFN